MPSEDLSRQLRLGSSLFLRYRRGVVGLSLAASGAMGLITLYQMGIIRHLPEPPLPGLDADKVDASAEAYEKLSSPDAAMGLASYGVTALLAAAGEEDRATRRPWLPVALAGKAMLDALQAGKLTWDQWARHRAFCSWCLLAASASFATLPLVFPEARAAIRHLKQPRRRQPSRPSFGRMLAASPPVPAGAGSVGR